ncbi:unnamed protein product, partial [Choristocarpus tenellus]
QPTFVPKKVAPGKSTEREVAEDDAYLVTTVVNGRDKKTDLIVMDAADLAKGPLCRMPLKGFVPHMLHGSVFPIIVVQLQHAA